MGLPSGKYRFFVADLEKDTLLLAGLVAHGSGNHTFAADPSFSNVNGSGCTSLGRYRIGTPSPGRFERAYKLYRLDSTNSQAFRRNIVLHSFSYVPEAETDPYPICNSLGCPMVSPSFLRQLEPLNKQLEHLLLLQTKINKHLNFIESGHVYTNYPTAKGKNIIINIYAKFSLNDPAEQFLKTARQIVQSAGFDLRVSFVKDQ